LADVADTLAEPFDEGGLKQPLQDLDHHQQQQQQQTQQSKAGKGKGVPLGGPLSLTVGSQMETGEWKTNGEWVKKDKAAEEKVPSNLQVISADDLIKVMQCTLLKMARCHARSTFAVLSTH
jgi:hypothetical protein